MKYYIRQIKPYVKPPFLPGMRCILYPLDGYDWVSEDLEEELKNNIVLEDPWSTLTFKERFVEVKL